MRLLALSSVLLAVCALSCTNSDPIPVYVETNYQLRCIDCVPRAADNAARNIKALDGEGLYAISCSVNGADGSRTASFSVRYTGDDDVKHELRVRQARIDGDGHGRACEVRVIEGSNTYAGSCTSDDPTADKPCQLSFDTEGSTLIASIYCEGLPNISSPMFQRYLTKPLVQSPAKFTLDPCL